MAIAKVILNGVTQLDVTQDTVTSGSMLNGITAKKNDGTTVTGNISSVTGGTPLATKGTVSNHTISVTPYVTNATGYITGGTKTGTAVTVSASELVSGTKSITENGTGIDVTDYASVDVSIASGSSEFTPQSDGHTHFWFNIVSENAKTVGVYLQAGGEVDWGDGTIETISAGLNYHTYQDVGLYDAKFGMHIGRMNNVAYKYRGQLEAVEFAYDISGTQYLEGAIGLKYAYYHNGKINSSYTMQMHRYNYALQKCRLDPNITNIGNSMFTECQSLSEIDIPENVTSIGTQAFQYCRSLSKITIPSGVTSIGDSAFQYCAGMTEYHLQPTTPPTLGTNAIQTPSGCVIYVPYSADHSILNAYTTATNWSSYASYMQEESA